MTQSEEILLVEDDEVIAELEKRVLSRAGWPVRAVHRLKDAVTLLREQPFRAIVLDYRLPDGEPWIVVTAANLRIPRVPVIMVTGMGSEGIAAEALHRGVSEYVKKADGFYHELPEAVSRVTKAAAAEESLHLGDRLFQLISGSLSDLILVANLDGEVSYVSPACKYILGYQAQELKAALDLELVHPDDQERVVDLLANIRRRGQSSLLFRCRAKQGDYRWIESNVNLLNDAVTGNQQVIAVSRDITERKNAEDEITKLNATLDLALNGAKDYAIFTLNREGRVASWNSGAERMKGYAAPEIIGRHFSIFYPIEDVRRQRPAEILAIAAREGRFEEEGWRVRKDGSRFWANVVISVLRDASGELCGFSKVTRDATGMKKAADDLLSACRRAEDANRAKSEFLAAMSHEIRTPMNAILGMTDLLKETELDAVQREYTERCRRAGASLLTLINDILDLSKIESGRFELEQVPFDLEDLVEQTTEMIAPRAHIKGVGLCARIDPETPVHLIGDPSRLRQILINLLGNAAKFTQQGEIVLTVTPVETGTDAASVRFDVSDTGIGIPAGKLGAIFEDYAQVDASTTRRFGGTGLGLGIARRLVNAMSGELTVSSVLGQGSTFSFNAVFAIDRNPLPSKLPQAAQDLVGRRVLIVDDNATNRLILSRMCSAWGMLPCEASSAPDASRLVQEALDEQVPFSLAIVDVLMPEVCGFAALAEIRALSPDIPIIMNTSNNQPGDATKARALGASAFAVKPIRRAEMLRLILAAIRPDRQTVAEERALPKGKAEAPARILVAEDSEDNRFLVEVYLSEGYDLTFVENGQDALDAFEKETFDLVLMDIQMPVMDGLVATELIRALERRNTRTRTPILALTADALLGDAERSHSAGCDGHLAKPICKEDLITAIENFRFAAQAT
jgi:PAS domain S-box-containing protein